MRRITYPLPCRLPFSSMRLATFLFSVVMLILILPFALATHPDPSWIAGVYDGADGDDVVTLVYETAGVEAVSLRSDLSLPCSSIGSSYQDPALSMACLPRERITRGPPAPFALTVYDVAITSPIPRQVPLLYRPERRQFSLEPSQDVGHCLWPAGGDVLLPELTAGGDAARSRAKGSHDNGRKIWKRYSRFSPVWSSDSSRTA